MNNAMHTSYTLDPLGTFSDVTPDRLWNACGILVPWALEPSYFHLPLKQAMEEQYGFGELLEIDGVTVRDNGVYTYPGDPPQSPLITIVRGTEIMHIYQHAIVAMRNEKREYFVTRMD